MNFNQRIRTAIKNPLLTIYGLYRIVFLFLTKPLSYFLKDILYSHHYIFWWWLKWYRKATIAKTAIINNAFLNVNSWEIHIKDYVFFWHNVSVITWTHDYNKFNHERMVTVPPYGRDIIIEEWSRIGASSIILWPCHIGKHSVVASWSVVTKDIPSYEIRWGVPAKIIKKINY